MDLTSALYTLASLSLVIAHFVYDFITTCSNAVLSGDSEEIKRILVTIATVYIGYRVLKRVLRIFSGILIQLFDILLILACFVFALSIYNNGIEATIAKAMAYVGHSVGDVSGFVTESAFDWQRAGNSLWNHDLFGRAREAAANYHFN